jgi:hypothetical protein
LGFKIEKLKTMPIDDAINLALAAPKNFSWCKELLEYYMEGYKQKNGVASSPQIRRFAESIPEDHPYFYEASKISIALRTELVMQAFSALETKPEHIAVSPGMFKLPSSKSSDTGRVSLSNPTNA